MADKDVDGIEAFGLAIIPLIAMAWLFQPPAIRTVSTHLVGVALGWDGWSLQVYNNQGDAGELVREGVSVNTSIAFELSAGWEFPIYLRVVLFAQGSTAEYIVQSDSPMEAVNYHPDMIYLADGSHVLDVSRGVWV